MAGADNNPPSPSSRLAPQARAFFLSDEARDSRYRDVAWRTMTAFDMPAVDSIAAQVHPGFFEAPEVLAERQQLYRNGCYLLEISEKATGYVLSHPWRAGNLPATGRTNSDACPSRSNMPWRPAAVSVSHTTRVSNRSVLRSSSSSLVSVSTLS